MKKARKIGSILLAVLMVLAATGCRPADTPATDLSDPTETQMQLQGTEATAAPQPNDPTEPDPTVSPSDPSQEPTDPQPSESLPTEPEPTEPSVPATAPTEPVPTDPPAAAHTHSYAASVVAPTCTAQGYTVHTCACGASYNDTYTAAVGHHWAEWAAVCSVGVKERNCSACGTWETEAIAMIEKDFELADPATAFEAEVAQAIIKYINQFRAEEGSTQLTYLSGMSQVAQYRSRQLVSNLAHDTTDIREAHAYYEYGEYVDWAEAGCPELVDQNYWSADDNEAIGMSGFNGTVDEIGKEIASQYRNSEGHWRYLSSSRYSYIGVGCTIVFSTEYNCYVEFDCVMVGSTNYG